MSNFSVSFSKHWALATIFLFCCSQTLLRGQQSAELVNARLENDKSVPLSGIRVIEKGAHHRVEQWVERVIDDGGRTNDIPHTYTVLAAGMHYLENGEWRETVPEFIRIHGGFVAVRGPHKVAVSDNIQVAGAVTVQSSDGVTWKSTPAALALRDSGGNVQTLGFLKATKADHVSPGTILFRNAFDGVSADVRVVYAANGVECDVILRQALRVVEGIDPDTAELVVLTEVFDSPEVAAEAVRLPVGPAGQEEGTDDVSLRLGTLRMDTGRAYGESLIHGDQKPEAPVLRRFYQQDGRTFLEEAAPLKFLIPALKSLPGARLESHPGRHRRFDPVRLSGRARELAGLLKPAQHTGLAAPDLLAALGRTASVTASLASLEHGNSNPSLPEPGIVLDWSYVNSVTTPFLFAEGQTYFITNGVTISGTQAVTFAKGTVIKYSNNGVSSLAISSETPVNWNAEPYSPIILTARDDSTVGETVAGAQGTLSAPYASVALLINGLGRTTPLVIQNLHVRYANLAVVAYYFGSGVPLTLKHHQVINCNNAWKFQYGTTRYTAPGYPTIISDVGTFRLQNCLIAGVGTVFKDSYYAAVSEEFVTIDTPGNYRQSQYNPDNSTFTICDSILVSCAAVANPINCVLANCTGITGPMICTQLSSSAGMFTTALAGNYYVSSGSPANRQSLPIDRIDNANSEILTASPPQEIQAITSGSTILTPPTIFNGISQVGYNYWMLHYVASNVAISGKLSLKNQVRIGMGGSRAFQLNAGASVSSIGTTSGIGKNLFVSASAVQEGPAGLTSSSFTVFSPGTGYPRPVVDARFTRFAFNADTFARRTLIQDGNDSFASIQLRDCEISRAVVTISPIGTGHNEAISFINNVWETNSLTFDRYYWANNVSVTLRNNLFRGGSLILNYYQDQTYPNPQWTVQDNLFLSTSDSSSLSSRIIASHNGYTASTALFGGTGNKTQLVPDFQTPPTGLGSYYYPSSGGATSLASLINQGSLSSATAGLWHFTTRADQLKDGADVPSAGDIGFHYLAPPFDSDGDGLLDYMEDTNGDGVLDATESSPTNSDSDGDILSDLLEIQIGANPRSTDTDGDGISDNEEYWSGSNARASGDIPGQRLDHWSFNAPVMSGDNGTSPTLNTATAAQSFDGLAACFTNSSARITYPASVTVSATNRPTFSYLNGTVRLSYTTDWGVNGNSSKPNQWVRLIECGDWKVSITPNGDLLVFQTPFASGGAITNLAAPLPTNSGSVRKHYDITLTYCPGFSRVVIKSGSNFTVSVDGLGVETDVPVAIKNAGWTLGNAINGGYPALGCIDELETFACQADPDWQDRSNSRFARLYDPRRRQANAFSAATLNYGIRLQWVRGWEGDWQTNAQLYGISRRTASSGSAFTSLTNGIRTNSWVDTTAALGAYYEYRLDRHPSVPILDHPVIVAARDGAPVDQRGRAILMIDQTLTNALWSDFEAYKRQLAADGWAVTNYYVPRHFDSPLNPDCGTYHGDAVSGWRANTNNMALIKDHIRREYTNNLTATNVVVILGHLPIPFSGLTGEDGHGCTINPPDHQGAWVSDMWYSDMTGTWTDVGTYNNCFLCIGDNIPGDGKFDQDNIPNEPDGSPGRLEMPLGRIDFAQLPVFANGERFPGVTTEAQAEVKLFQRYFDKVRRFRRGEIGFLRESRSWQGDGNFHEMIGGSHWINTRAFGAAALETFSPHFQGTDLFLASTNYLWGTHGDYGFFDDIGHDQNPIGRQHSSIDVAKLIEAPRGMFMLLDASFLGDWYYPDNLMRVCLGVPDTSLVTLWGRNHRWRTERVHAGMGMYAMLQDSVLAGLATSTQRSLLGDPTVREQYIRPVANLTTQKAGTTAVLTWPSNADADAGYRIYRAENINAAVWNLIGIVPAGTTVWTNTPANQSTNVFLIKGVGTRASGSGSFFVLSLGTSATNQIVIP
jgi:hypothetical protein